MANGDLYRLVWSTTLNNQPIQNRFYFLQIAGLGNVNDLMAEFKVSVIDPVMSELNDSLVNVDVLGDNIDDLTDFGTLPLTGNGAQVGDALPSFAVYYVRLDRGDKTFKHGRKALSGISEADQNNGVIDGGRLAALQSAFSVFKNNLLDANANEWQPVLARRIAPEGQPVTWIHTPITNSILVKISTQNSRKDFV